MDKQPLTVAQKKDAQDKELLEAIARLRETFAAQEKAAQEKGLDDEAIARLREASVSLEETLAALLKAPEKAKADRMERFLHSIVFTKTFGRAFLAIVATILLISSRITSKESPLMWVPIAFGAAVPLFYSIADLLSSWQSRKMSTRLILASGAELSTKDVNPDELKSVIQLLDKANAATKNSNIKI